MAVQKIKYSDHDNWLDKRRQGIGGSEAGVIMGVSKWSTPYLLYKDKIGEGIEKEETINMVVGTASEESVAQWFCKKEGKRVQKRHYIMRNPQYPWALGNIDRKIVGENAILECKTTVSLPTIRDFKHGDFPDTWYCQVQHYMAVGGYDKAYIACFILLGGKYEMKEVPRDDDFIKVMMEKEEEFWNRVTRLNPPPVEGHEDEYKLINSMYPVSDKVPAYLETAAADLESYDDLGEQIKVLKKMQDACKERICMQMGMSDTGYIGKDKVCTWKEQSRKSFMFDEFRKDFPNFDISAYTKVSNSRVFKLLKK